MTMAALYPPNVTLRSHRPPDTWKKAGRSLTTGLNFPDDGRAGRVSGPGGLDAMCLRPGRGWRLPMACQVPPAVALREAAIEAAGQAGSQRKPLLSSQMM